MDRKVTNTICSSVVSSTQVVRTSQARLLGVAAVVLLSACTAVPTQQFSTYKETFAKAQAAGEEVLIDHAAARTKAVEFSASRRAARPMETERLTKVPQLSVSEAVKATDDVAVRMRAWNVVGRFNDAMTALAEGRSVAEVAKAADGVLQSLNAFPIDAVKELGADLVPFAGAIKGLLAAAEMEISKQAFLHALTNYGPVIRNSFIGLLRKDIDEFYQIRYLLNDREYRQIFFDIRNSVRQFRELAARFQATADVQAIVVATSSALATLPVSPERSAMVDEFKGVADALGKPPAGAAAADALAFDKLQRLRDEINDAVQRALAKNGELTRYGEVLVNYGVLLTRTERSLKAVEDAANNPSRSEPPSDELLKSVILLRQAFLKYRENQ